MTVCESLHAWANARSVYDWSFDSKTLPENGIYIVFEKGELGHGGNRIVRIGTHTGDRQLRSRLRQHFIQENKDRSIFRKNIGRAMLSRAGDTFAPDWEIDLTPRASREKHSGRIDMARQSSIEKAVTRYIQESFTFVVVAVGTAEERLRLEAKLIGTVARCGDCGPSSGWLGRFSPVEKISRSGLWLVQGLDDEPLSDEELKELSLM